MAGEGEGGQGEEPRKRRLTVTLGVVAMALVVAIATAVGTDLGSRIVDLFDSDSEPVLVTSSDAEEVVECGTSLFVPGDRARQLVAGDVPTEPDWPAFKRENEAVTGEESVVEVSVQGESARTITLTGIRFEVERRQRPEGAVFINPCGGPVTGRSVRADLDSQPVRITATASRPDDVAGSFDAEGKPLFRPIRFPWTVSVTDPLTLYILATTKRCLCRWRAFIEWRSGGESGELAVDNDGDGYAVAGVDGVRMYKNGGTQAPGPSPWSESEY